MAPGIHVLHPGDVACGGAGERFETLLGSCVSVILADPWRSVGAMCHIVHARTPSSKPTVCASYAAHAISTMYALVRARNLNPILCEAWVVGGGNMFPSLHKQGHVGDDNVQWVLQALHADGVRVRSIDVGGEAYRRLAWTIGPGDPEVTRVEV